MIAPFKFTKCLAASAALLALSAHAELQVWRMTGMVYDELTSQGGAYVPPSSAYAHGKTVNVDYVVDTAVTAPDGGSTYSAIRTFTVNGIGSYAEGTIWADGVGLNALNVGPTRPRSDQVSFLSFNRFNGPKATSVSHALADFSTATAAGVDVDYRIDFGSAGSVRIRPTSFTQQTLPARCKFPLFRLIDPQCEALRLIK
ncbi:hypothetical protein [Aquabacterium sp.]|jgi:hypothetical protein|uniref:hypothetical protein n=1 Tax=Aquabacterium sp. TaxID=1872578 RepID=UPI0025BE75D4|nr:hypothetical protein [Aquabacterium sp.]